MVDEIWTAFQQTHQRRIRLEDLLAQEITTLESEATNLSKAIRKGGKIPALIKDLKQINRRIKVCQAKLAKTRDANRQYDCLQSKEHVAAQLDEALRIMIDTSFDFAESLRRFFRRSLSSRYRPSTRAKCIPAPGCVSQQASCRPTFLPRRNRQAAMRTSSWFSTSSSAGAHRGDSFATLRPKQRQTPKAASHPWSRWQRYSA